MTTLGATSNSLSVTSGVPQGSIFVFVPSVCQVSARCSYIKPDCRFCRWYKGLKEITSKHDAEQLKGDLSDLIMWSDSRVRFSDQSSYRTLQDQDDKKIPIATGVRTTTAYNASIKLKRCSDRKFKRNLASQFCINLFPDLWRFCFLVFGRFG